MQEVNITGGGTSVLLSIMREEKVILCTIQ